MAKILTGIQSTGTPHLGNILGAIIPAVEMANSTSDESYLFIANMHSLTQIKDEKILKIFITFDPYNFPECILDLSQQTLKQK